VGTGILTVQLGYEFHDAVADGVISATVDILVRSIRRRIGRDRVHPLVCPRKPFASSGTRRRSSRLPSGSESTISATIQALWPRPWTWLLSACSASSCPGSGS